MRNIIRALNYQTRNDIVVIVSLLFLGVFSVISPVLNFSGLAFSDMTGSMYAVSSDKSIIIFLMLIITTRICGWDQSDKTINYELFAGHSRMAILFRKNNRKLDVDYSGMCFSYACAHGRMHSDKRLGTFR